MALPEVKVRITADTAQAVRGLDQVEAGLQGVRGAAPRASASAGRLGGALGRLGSVSSSTQSKIQLVSYQLQDMIVQLQMGTRASVVMGQQLPQAASAFGVWGAAIGVAVGLLAPLAGILLATRREAEGFDDVLDSLSDTMSSAERAMDILQMSAREMREEFGEAAEAVRSLTIAQAQLSSAQASRRMADALAIANDELREYIRLNTSETGSIFRSGTMYSTAIRNVARDFGIASDEAREVSDVLREIWEAQGFEEQSDALQRLMGLLSEYNVDLERIPPELATAIDEMITLTAETERANQAMNNLRNAAEGAALGMTFGTGLSVGDGGLLPPAPGGRRRGAPARSRTDTYARELEALQDSLRTRQEVINDWHSESLAILENQRAQEFLTEQEHRESLLRLEQEYQSRMAQVREVGRAQEIAAVLGAGQEILAAAGQNNERLFRLSQTFGAAEALVNAYRAAAQALADPSLPWFAKAGAAASLLAAGIGFANSIKSMSKGGGGGSVNSSVAAGTSQQAGAASSPGGRSTAYLQINGETFGREQIVRLIEGINEATEDGARLVIR